MHARHQISWLAATVLLLCVAGTALALPSYGRKTKMSCATCHTCVAGGTALNAAGTAFKADHAKVPAASVAGADYVGSNKCKMCHMKQHKAWMETKHAKAFESLTTGDPAAQAAMAKAAGVALGKASTNDACLACHTVGSKIGGYPPADETKMASYSEVGCEMCHGPGSKHASAEKAEKKALIFVPKTEAMCKDCHTSAMSPKFAFADYKKRGVHIVPAATP
jgi:hypothetical protein